MLLDLQQKAEQDLRFIRQAMERVEGVSSVSGLGGILMGLIALGATWIASELVDLRSQLEVWIYSAMFAVSVGAAACWRKAVRGDAKIHWDPVRRFLLCLVPVILVAVVLTFRLWPTPSAELIPALWLMLYGCGTLAAGTYAVNAVLSLGGCFIVVGLTAMVTPVEWSNALLAVGFGGLHIVFGAWVYRYHGG